MGEHQSTTDTYFHWFGIARHTNTNTNTNKKDLKDRTLRDGPVATFY